MQHWRTLTFNSEILIRYLQQTVAAHRSVTRPVAFIRWPVSKAVAPFLHHVEALGMPNVRLQPNVLPLPAVELQQQVSVAPAGLAALAFCLFLLLGLEALCVLEGKATVSVIITTVHPFAL